MQSLFFSRASLSEGDNDSNLTRITIAGLFLRDTFSCPPCTLVQPSMQSATEDAFQVPEFARSFCPPIYPLGEQQWQLIVGTPLICIHTLQIKPSPLPPSLASQTVIDCQPLMVHLHEESCLRISSFLADGIVVNRGDILPDSSVNSFIFTLKGLDTTVPLDKAQLDFCVSNTDDTDKFLFVGARLHIENLFVLDSPLMKLIILNLEEDPACFCLWEDQPIDASQKKWAARASHLTLSLETNTGTLGHQNSLGWTAGFWRCVDLKDACIEVAMATADGSPLLEVPPPAGIVRVGVSCEQCLSNTSIEQLFFVLDLYDYFGRVSEKIVTSWERKQMNDVRNEPSSGKLLDKVPSDAAVSLALKNLQLRFLESSSVNVEGRALVQFIGADLFISATHRTLGGAIVVSSTLHWESVEIDCVDSEEYLACEHGSAFSSGENVSSVNGVGYPQLRAVFWVDNSNHLSNVNAHSVPFLNLSMNQVIPFCEVENESNILNVSASISGVRLGGGMNYAEALLHRSGILGPDGGPGKGLSKGLEDLQKGPLAKLFKTAPLIVDNSENESMIEGIETSFPPLKKPDDVAITIELRDWLFALEGAQDLAERWWFSSQGDLGREQKCWHTTFHSLLLNAKSSPKKVSGGKLHLHRIQYPLELLTVGIQGLQFLKPTTQKDVPSSMLTANEVKKLTDADGGISLEMGLILHEDNVNDEMAYWEVENLKFSIKQPFEAVVTKDEFQSLTFLCKSEIESMGRITAGILRLLKLEGSVGQSVMDQLGNLGSEGVDHVLLPEKLSEGIDNVLSPEKLSLNESPHKSVEPTITLLEEAVVDSQAKINALITDIGTSESSLRHVEVVKQLSEKFELMQGLLTQLRNQL